MERLNLPPRSKEWHAKRAESWTASLAAVLCVEENAKLLQSYAGAKGVSLDIEPLLKVGLKDFFANTLWTVWADKTGTIPKFRGNEDTERGVRNEEKILDWFETNQLIPVEREVTALSGTRPWLLASFDGLAPPSSDVSRVAPNGFPVEVKCPAFPTRKKMWDSKKAGSLAVLGTPYYWCQVQHQILVADSPYGWFVVSGVEQDEKGEEKLAYQISEKVPRDEEFLIAYEAAAKFYHQEFLEGFDEPPKLPSDVQLLQRLKEKADFDRAIAAAEPGAAVDLYLAALREEENAIRKRKELESKVLEAAAQLRKDGSDVVLLGHRLQVTYTTTSSVSWQKVAKMLATELGHPDVPDEVRVACESRPRESVKVKELGK